MELIQNRHDAIKQKNKIFFIITIFFTAVASMLRFFLIMFEVDPHSNLYVSSNLSLKVFDYGIAAVALFIWLSSKFMYVEKIRFVNILMDTSNSTETDADKNKKNKAAENKYYEAAHTVVQDTQSLVFSSALTGCFLLGASIMQGIAVFTDPIWTHNLGGYIKENTFDFALFFIAILSAIYFFKTAYLKAAGNNSDDAAPKLSQGYIIFSFFPVIWTFLNIFKCFFDMSKSVNSPIRIYELVSFLAISLYFVAESRMLVGKRETGKFFSSAYMAILLISLSSLPHLVLSSFWILETSTPLMVYGVQLSFLIYIAARIYSQIKYGEFLLVKIPTFEKSKSEEPESELPESQ